MSAPLHPSEYPETPIFLGPNPNTGYNWGEDGPNEAVGNPGYRAMQTLASNEEPLVEPIGMEQRSVFDGQSLYADPKDPTVYQLPGGLEGGRLVMRELPARALDLAAENIDQATSGEIRMVIVDGLETFIRQRAGFTKTLNGLFVPAGIQKPTITELYTFGKKAEGTYAYVKADKKSPAYADVARELLESGTSSEEIRALAAAVSTKTGMPIEAATEKVVFELITMSTNANVGPAADRGVALDFEHNAHAGGAAADVFPVDNRTGQVLSLVPYCWVGEEAAMDYLENDANYERFLAKWTADETLQVHMKQVGFNSPEDFTRNDWERFRMANRVRYHALVGVGCTFYSADPSTDGGENWHFEPDGVELVDWDGRIVAESKYVPFSTQYGSGNPGHTLQMQGPSGIAVYGGRSGHEQARKQFGLEF